MSNVIDRLNKPARPTSQEIESAVSPQTRSTDAGHLRRSRDCPFTRHLYRARPSGKYEGVHLVSIRPLLPHERRVEWRLEYPPLPPHNRSQYIRTVQKLKASHGPQRESVGCAARPGAAL